jgi:hypothetical protein
MPTSPLPRTRIHFWRNPAVLQVGYLAAASYLILMLCGPWAVEPPFLGWLVIFVALSGVTVLSHWLSPKYRLHAAFERLESEFESIGDDVLATALGPRNLTASACGSLSMLPGDEHLLKTHLHSQAAERDETLRFYLLVRLATTAARTADWPQAVEHLKSASGLKPSNIVANVRLAQALEAVGDGTGALAAYELAKDGGRALSPQIEEYVQKQIERVQARGPNKQPLCGVLRFMSGFHR